MDSKEFLENFKSQFIDADEINLELESDFRDIDSWDSLTGMAIIVMIEDEYGKKIEDGEFKAAKTVKDLFELVQAK